MEKNKFTKGRIVVTMVNLSRGNPAGSIVKILSEPGKLSDEATEASGKTESDAMKEYVLCEALPNLSYAYPVHYNNKQAFYQRLISIRLAETDEKKAYAKGIRHTYQVKYNLW